MAKTRAPASEETQERTGEPAECFIIMPISDQPGYAPGHFTLVYEDIIAPAVVAAGFAPRRADQINATNLIHLDILARLVEAPLAVCDLSAVNPNVMFELGIRQAFDKPVVLLRDEGTRPVFDIAPIRYVTYNADLRHRSVLKAVDDLTAAIRATAAAQSGEGVNSIVRLLGLRAAGIPASPHTPEAARLEYLERLIEGLTSEVRGLRDDRSTPASLVFQREGERLRVAPSSLKSGNIRPQGPPTPAMVLADALLKHRTPQQVAEDKASVMQLLSPGDRQRGLDAMHPDEARRVSAALNALATGKPEPDAEN